MNRIRRILAGVEFSPERAALTPGSLQAVREAAWLCSRTGASLTLLHSTWHDDLGEPGPPPPEATLDLARAAAAECGCDPRVEIVEERPALAIGRAGVRGETDLVCVGRRSARDEPGFGSVADKLVRKCPVPVWALRPNASAPPKRILVATDLSPVADRATGIALAIAGYAGADVRILHAWQVPLQLQMSEGRVADSVIAAKRKELQDRAVAHIKKTLANKPDVRVQLHVLCDAPTRAIRRDVDEHKADLVALGTVSRGGIAGFLIGNTAERILRRIEVSVLAVKPDDFISPLQA